MCAIKLDCRDTLPAPPFLNAVNIIEQWREAINFSQLFIEAFDREVQAQSRLSKLKDAEMKAVVKRLKKESEQTFEGGDNGDDPGLGWRQVRHDAPQRALDACDLESGVLILEGGKRRAFDAAARNPARTVRP